VNETILRRRKLSALKFYGLHNFQNIPIKELIQKDDLHLFVDGKELIAMYFETCGPNIE
jgi:hypothetical protein